MLDRLVEMILEKSFKLSDHPTFKLASGKLSNYYINCKPTTLDPEGMNLIGNIIFDKIKDENIDVIGGLSFGADPIAVATAFASGLRGGAINAFSIRKELKDHGIVDWIEGDVKPDTPVVIIDDVATTGRSTVKAVERARESGLIVVKVVILVDREEGGLENIRKEVDDVSAIITRSELMKAGDLV